MTAAYARTAHGTLPTRRWLVAAAVAVAVTVNCIAAAFGAQSNADDAPTLVEPAGYAFSIWFLIFASNVAYAAYQLAPAQSEDGTLDRAARPFIAGQVMATLFAFAALTEARALGQVATLGYFIAAALTYVQLRVGDPGVELRRRLATWLPASLALGWLLAAAIVTIAGFLQNDLELSAPLFSATTWAVATTVAASGTALLLLFTRRDLPYALAVAWALAGIAVQQSSREIDITVAVCVSLIMVAAAGLGWRWFAVSRGSRPRSARAP